MQHDKRAVRKMRRSSSSSRRTAPPSADVRKRPGRFERLARKISDWSGSTAAFVGAFLVIIAWGVTGPLFHYGETWQLVINTGTTIVTFLMVFLIQRAQNKDSLAIQLKLNELIAATHGTSNRLVNVEELSEAELRTLRDYYARLTELAASEESIFESHSVEEARRMHSAKEEHAS